MRTGDITVEATTEYDVTASRLFSRYRFVRQTDGEGHANPGPDPEHEHEEQQQRQFEATAIHHVYTSGHLGDLLEAGGFTGAERYADPSGTPYSLGADRLLLVAHRRQ